jgi:hypothetical protein
MAIGRTGILLVVLLVVGASSTSCSNCVLLASNFFTSSMSRGDRIPTFFRLRGGHDDTRPSGQPQRTSRMRARSRDDVAIECLKGFELPTGVEDDDIVDKVINQHLRAYAHS